QSDGARDRIGALRVVKYKGAEGDGGLNETRCDRRLFSGHSVQLLRQDFVELFVRIGQRVLDPHLTPRPGALGFYAGAADRIAALERLPRTVHPSRTDHRIEDLLEPNVFA